MFHLIRRCILCNKPSQQTYDLCLACEKDLPWLTNCCDICGIYLPKIATKSLTPNGTLQKNVCGQCLVTKPLQQQTIALFQYTFPIDQLIANFKFHHKLAYGQVLGHLLSKRLMSFYTYHSLPQVIIPVPLHTLRYKERGFNQAEKLARPIHHLLRIPILNKICRRIKQTDSQTALSANIRRHNLKHAFKATITKQLPKSKPYRVAIIDDVITTGATSLATMKAMRQAYPLCTFDIWCIARTINISIS